MKTLIIALLLGFTITAEAQTRRTAVITNLDSIAWIRRFEAIEKSYSDALKKNILLEQAIAKLQAGARMPDTSQFTWTATEIRIKPALLSGGTAVPVDLTNYVTKPMLISYATGEQLTNAILEIEGNLEEVDQKVTGLSEKLITMDGKITSIKIPTKVTINAAAKGNLINITGKLE